MALRGLVAVTEVVRRIRPVPVATAAGGIAALAIVAFAAAQSFAGPDAPSAGTFLPAGTGSQALNLSALGILDTDIDGLGDAAENYVYGTDPRSWQTSGSGIPDGWLARFRLDLHDPGIADRPATAPASTSLPPAYHEVWPDRFRATIGEVYSYGRPPTWNESVQGPFENGLDPTAPDGNRDGIPDGFLLRFGLDPLDGNLSAARLAGPEGLTVLDAYQHATDPRSLDTDGDGIPDREEMDGPINPHHPEGPKRFPPTDPIRADTAGTGVCDGWLRAHGLDPGVPDAIYADSDRDGATTQEEGLWSQGRFGSEACSQGKGLDPRLQATASLSIPDGWLIRYGLDPLDSATPSERTQESATDPGPAVATAAGLAPASHVNLTVLDEYRHARPGAWNESRDGVWWGGTNPSNDDTDSDGLGDAWEQRGYAIAVAADPSHAAATAYWATADPTQSDSDGDGLDDGAEADPSLRAPGGVTAVTDARRADSDFDGLSDRTELFAGLGLDPTRADSVGDVLRDGERLRILEGRAAKYGLDLSYEHPGAWATADAWLANAGGADDMAKPLSRDAVAQLVKAAGDIDGDGQPNILDKDIDEDGLHNGWEVRPPLYALSPFGPGEHASGRPRSDPLNADTDGDGLADGWEIGFGVIDSTGSYNLDPGKFDSDGDGESDADEDPDGDSMVWYSYTGSALSPTRIANEFEFTNIFEHEAGTDPNRFASDRDGLGDGWKVFWGQKYPLKSGAELGLFHPGGKGFVEVPTGTPLPRVGTAQADVEVLPTYQYERFVLFLAEKLPSETWVPSGEVEVPDAKGTLRTLNKVQGAFPLNFTTIQAARTNPYMATSLVSSDGDGMADAWELVHRAALPGTSTAGKDEAGCQPLAGPDPTRPDDGQDLDGDGLPNFREFLLGADPLCVDSDLGVLGDGQEAGAGSDPADPEDDQRLLNERLDSDADGVCDFEELTGTGAMRQMYSHLPGVIRTDPDDPDSDGDGLLDGRNVPGSSGPCAMSATDSGVPALVQRFLDLGIAYRKNGADYLFLGEGDLGTTDPRDGDDAGIGIPAGWLVAHSKPVSPESVVYLDHYRLGMPSWWNASTGPWWGGMTDLEMEVPTGDLDLDRDGLADQRGGDHFEDPMPANQPNSYRAGVPYATYGLTPPPASADPTTPGLEPEVRRLLAQSYLNPRVVGEGYLSRGGAATDTVQRGTPCLDIEGLGPANQARKGTPGTISGTVTDCAGNGIAGLTVEALLQPSQGDPQAFGAGFTDEAGGFSFPVNVSATQSVEFTSLGTVLRGRTSGTVTWSPDPAKVAVGSNVLAVRTGTTTLGAPFQAFGGKAWNSVSAFLPIQVKAGSVLTFSISPATVPTGQDLEVPFRLTDTGGTPLADPVDFELAGIKVRAHPRAADGEGVAVFSDVPAKAAGDQSLTATSRPSSIHVDGASAQSTLALRVPASFRLDSLPTSVDAGKAFMVKGRLVADGDRVPGARLAITVTGPEGPVGAPVATGSGSGTFEVPFTLPAGLPYGDYTIGLKAAATNTTSQASLAGTILVRSVPVIRVVSSGPIEVGQPADVVAALFEPDGSTPVPAAKLDVRVGQAETTVTTDALGRINATLAADFAAGPALQTIDFAGDGHHAGTGSRTERPVRSATTLDLPAGKVARGGNVSVAILLRDAAGNALTNQAIDAKWGEEPARQILTNAHGVARLVRTGSGSDPLGNVLVRAAYAGSPDGTLAPSVAEATWSVRALVGFSLPNGTFEAGSSIPLGELRDAGTGEPLPHQPLVVRLGANVTQRVTDDEGRFTVVPPAPRNADPLAFDVRVDYLGGPLYPAEHAVSRVALRSPVTLDASDLPTLVAGRPTVALVELQDARGQVVPTGTVNATLDGMPIGSAPVQDGLARVELRTPAGQRAGSAEVRFSYLGTETHGPASATVSTQVVASVDLVIKVDVADPGAFATVRVLATTGGAPLPGAPIFLQVEGLPGGLEATTDKNGVATFEVLQANGTLALSARYAGTHLLAPAAASSALVPSQPFGVADGMRLGAWIAAAVALVLAVAAGLAYRTRSHPLAPAIRRARILLARGPYEKQILRAYQVLEEAAIADELLAGEAHTPRLLQQAIEPTLPAALRPGLETLITLFETARYGTAPLGPAHRDAALAALLEMRSQLAKMAAFGPARTAGAP